MRTSKYVGKEFDNGWVCTEIVLSNVQGKRSKAPGKRNYRYIFQRRTSDNQADKIIVLNSTDAANVYKGRLLVEELADVRHHDKNVRRSVTYSFN